MSTNFLDLTVFKEDTFDIKLLDGSMIKIKKPSQKMFMEFIAYQDMKTDNQEEVIQALDILIIKIINNNTDGKEFTIEQLDFTFDMKLAIMQAYVNFITNLVNQKN